MKIEEETLRDAIRDALAQSKIDMRDIAVDLANGRAAVRGTVPSPEQYALLLEVIERANLGALLRCDVTVAPVS